MPTPSVNNTGKIVRSGVWVGFTVKSVNTGNSTFAIDYDDTGDKTGIPFGKFHARPAQDFIIGEDTVGVSAPTVNDKAMLFYNGDVPVTVVRVHSGTSTFDVQIDGTTDELTGIPYANFGDTPTGCDYIIGDDGIE